MAQHKITNISDGPRYLNAVPGVILAPGEEVTVEISDAEVKAFGTFGYFESSTTPSEPGPLDLSVEDLTTHLATVTDPDAIDALIAAETAGKSRKGAITALEARRDELLA